MFDYARNLNHYLVKMDFLSLALVSNNIYGMKLVSTCTTYLLQVDISQWVLKS